jgi:hypothetical protein
MMHKAMEMHWDGITDIPATLGMTQVQEQMFNNTVAWFQEHEFRPLAKEVRLTSKVHKYGGTPDIVGAFGVDVTDDNLTIAAGYDCIPDYKFKKQLDPVGGPAQKAGYKGLVEENLGITTTYGLDIWVSPITCTVKPVIYDLNWHWPGFLALKEAYEYVKKMGRWKQ